MTQMIRLFATASTQPSQHLLPTRIVETTVRTQDKQSSRNMNESTSNFILPIVLRMGGWRCDRGPKDITLVTERPAFAMESVAVRRTNPLAFQGVAEINPKAGLESPPAVFAT